MPANRNITTAKNSKRKNNPINVVIPAAGIGKRMKSKGAKALFETKDGTSILEKQIKVIKKVLPKSEIFVIAGFQYDKIRNKVCGKLPARIIYNKDYETTNVTYGVSLGLDASLPGDLLIIHGDLIFNDIAIKSIDKKKSCMIVDTNNHIDQSEIGVCYDNNIATSMSYSSKEKWGQIVFMTGKELNMFQKICRNYSLSSQWFLHEAISNIINRGGKFSMIKKQTINIFEVDKKDDLKRI